MNKEIESKVGELKPCPFCGGKAELSLVGNDYMGCKKAEVKCTKCFVKRTQRFLAKKFDYDFIAKSVREHWNNRV